MIGKHWAQYPLRTAIKRHECALRSVVFACDGVIRWGQAYRDGGKGRRAHSRCVRLALRGATSDDALQLMSGALAAGLFGLRADRTKGAVN